MKLFKSLSIKAKLLIGFLSVAVLLVLVGIMGTLSIEFVAQGSQNVVTQNVPDMEEMHLIKENLLNIRSELQRAVLYGDPEKTKSAVNAIEEYKNENQTYIDSYSSRIEGAEEEKVWSDFLKEMDDYRAAREEVLEFALAGQYSQAEAGMDDVTKTREIMFSSIDKLIENNQSF